MNKQTWFKRIEEMKIEQIKYAKVQGIHIHADAASRFLFP